jgi:hypothetical protein
MKLTYPQDFESVPDFKTIRGTPEIIGLKFVNEIDLEFLIRFSTGDQAWFPEDLCPCPNQIPTFFKRFEKTIKLFNKI